MRSVCNSLTIAYFLCTGTACTLLHSDGNSPSVIQDLKVISEELHNELPQILIIGIVILSGQYDLFGFKHGSFKLFSKFHLKKS